jgi:CDP-diacylglycerol---glycerol-3-phosphate 3-phosphatidyltransferase
LRTDAFMTPRVGRTTISLTCAGLIVIIVATAGLRSYIAAASWRFATAASLTWFFLMVTVARLQRELSSTDETEPTPISPATFVTIARGLLIALIAGCAFDPAPTGVVRWLPGALYTLAALADRADGALARRTGITTLGARLDVVMDAVGLLVAPVVGVLWGRLPPWYLAVACAYPAFRGGLEVRRAWGRPVFPERLAPDPRARFFAGVQMTVVAASLFPVLPRALTWSAATLAMMPTLALFAGEWRLATRSATDGRARAERLDA